MGHADLLLSLQVLPGPRTGPLPLLGARLRRVLLQRAWKVCGTFARAVVNGKGETYRRYLPGELALVRRLLGSSPEDRRFAEVLEARAGAGLLS